MNDLSGIELTLDARTVERAARRIEPLAVRTPVLTARTLDEMSGASLYFKCENFQRTGAFKIRGASNAVLALSPTEGVRGVATHSSGNHGAALACAAASRGIDCHVVVPRGAVKSKLANIERYGAHIIPCEPTQEARENGMRDVIVKTGATPIPPYDDPRIIAGQGTVAMELLEQVPDLDSLVVPVGGGGLLGGCALWAKHKRPDIEIYGAEPAGADDTARSFSSGTVVSEHQPDTICDGLRGKLGLLNFALIRRHVEDILTLEDPATIDAMRLIWQVLKTVVEPSCALALGVVLANRERFAGKRVGVVISGGNVDLDNLPW
ncbi:MAG: pyridoxal-phosphate dependent enzyme [Pseudomonadota bacterium]